MRRRDFLKKGTVAAGLASSPQFLVPLTASESGLQEPSRSPGGEATSGPSLLAGFRNCQAGHCVVERSDIRCRFTAEGGEPYRVAEVCQI